ncbi:uncharacterized protein LOC129858117 [Salvelinus fontinalis]|uniref:uncharacterized protein LOC129858117 n=1 Tax=Salvelinus fontinalis TaxID=8038 RepID=UPI002486392E|nr:uncharacterized protein LOC129858117 [Salvelinus fontinalis]
MVTSTAEHRTQSTQVREEQSYTHTAYTHTSNTGHSNTHLAQVYMPQPEPSYTHTAHVEQCSTVTHPAHTHLPLSHTSPLPYSTPNSVQPTSALPPTSLPPSPGEERKVMTRRRLRGEINIQPIVWPKKRHGERNIDRTRLLIKKKRRIKKGYSVNTRNCEIVSGPLPDVDDVFLGVSVRTGEELCQPEDAARETPTPSKLPNQVTDALPGVCTNKQDAMPACSVRCQNGEGCVTRGGVSHSQMPTPVNRTIRSAEKIKSQTKARPAAV